MARCVTVQTGVERLRARNGDWRPRHELVKEGGGDGGGRRRGVTRWFKRGKG